MSYAVKNPMPGVVYPNEERTKRYVEAGELPTIGLVEALIDSFARNADCVAVYSADGAVTYGELDDVTSRFAAALMRLGLQPLDRVVFQIGNSKELVFAFVGCLKAGMIPICTLPAHRESEIGYLARHAGATAHIVVGDDPKFDMQEFALKMQPEIPTMRHIISVRGESRAGVVRIEDLIAAEDGDEAREKVGALPRDAYQVCVFQLSGGTTGIPKIIPRMSNDYYLNMKLTAELYDFSTSDVVFMPMPMIHNACMVCFWGPTLLSGAAFAIPADMTPESWGEVFRKRNPTWIGMMRAAMPRFEAMLDRGLAKIENVRGAWSPDAAPIFQEKFGLHAIAMFGMTEGLNLCTRMDDPSEVRTQTVGRPLSKADEVVLVLPGTDEPAPRGTPGELTCRGPYTLSGYYDAPERNTQAINSEGFYNSGDLLIEVENDGQINYVFAGRTKDVVVRGMEKISAEEVENALVSHPSVSDCAVVGMPDEIMGERTCVFVVPRTGEQAPSLNAVVGHMEAKGLAKYKWPERVESIEAMPLTRVGKLDKAALRKIIGDQLEAEASIDCK